MLNFFSPYHLIRHKEFNTEFFRTTWKEQYLTQGKPFCRMKVQVLGQQCVWGELLGGQRFQGFFHANHLSALSPFIRHHSQNVCPENSYIVFKFIEDFTEALLI